MKLFISLLGLGTTVGGIFMGSIQQNVFRTGKPYIDELFHEIEKDIRDFSNRNPLTATQTKYIKTGNSSSTEIQTRRKRSVETSEEAKPENTLEVWTDIWIQLLSNYIHKLWIGDHDVSSLNSLDPDLESRNFSLEDKQKAIDAAEKTVGLEKQRFEKTLDSAREKIEEIYKKMKKFLLIMELLKKYNTTDYADIPYGEYVRKILEE